jgi:hypothetical protein
VPFKIPDSSDANWRAGSRWGVGLWTLIAHNAFISTVGFILFRSPNLECLDL